MADGPSIYPHRQNSSDSWDSICPLCYRTVAREKSEGALQADEISHDCVALEIMGYAAHTSMK